jgi:hypothetical protein
VAIEGRNAFLVEPDDVGQVAAALARLAADPELRVQMAAESRAIDRQTDGVEVEAFVEAARRYSPSSTGSTSARSRATEASGR